MQHLVTGVAILILAISSAPILSAEAAEHQTVTFTVDKMTCATCPIAVRKAMERVEGVKDVNVDLDSKTATVIYDVSKATADEIGAASTDVGFPATVQGSQDQ